MKLIYLLSIIALGVPALATPVNITTMTPTPVVMWDATPIPVVMWDGTTTYVTPTFGSSSYVNPIPTFVTFDKLTDDQKKEWEEITAMSGLTPEEAYNSMEKPLNYTRYWYSVAIGIVNAKKRVDDQKKVDAQKESASESNTGNQDESMIEPNVVYDSHLKNII